MVQTDEPRDPAPPARDEECSTSARAANVEEDDDLLIDFCSDDEL